MTAKLIYNNRPDSSLWNAGKPFIEGRKCLKVIKQGSVSMLLFLMRRGSLVVSMLDFRSGGQWSEPSLCRRVVSLDKKLYSTLSLFTQVYKWVPVTIMLGGNLAMY